mmetsp:Transcript_1480/g.3116  ORF Transcript_1480/g.3116 Transcript_1480/m.3116 type:complete len:204 (+) Transcript_1480:2034-2645(+)
MMIYVSEKSRRAFTFLLSLSNALAKFWLASHVSAVECEVPSHNIVWLQAAASLFSMLDSLFTACFSRVRSQQSDCRSLLLCMLPCAKLRICCKTDGALPPDMLAGVGLAAATGRRLGLGCDDAIFAEDGLATGTPFNEASCPFIKPPLSLSKPTWTSWWWSMTLPSSSSRLRRRRGVFSALSACSVSVSRLRFRFCRGFDGGI